MSEEKNVINIGTLPHTKTEHFEFRVIKSTANGKPILHITEHSTESGVFLGTQALLYQTNLVRFITLLQKAHAKISSAESKANMQVSH